MNKKKHIKLGFTLVELLVVIAILTILAVAAIPTYSSFVEKARYTTAYQTIDSKFREDLYSFVSSNGSDLDDYTFYYEYDGYYFSNKNNQLVEIEYSKYCEIKRKYDPLNWEGKIVSILGDSISTFDGYNPIDDGVNLTHRVRYSTTEASWYFNANGTVNDTYWMKLINETGATLGINDSWAGSRVSNNQNSNSGDFGPDACMASSTRIKNLGSNGTPDIIIYYGGTNDIGGNVSIGTFDSILSYEVDLTTTKWTTFASAYKDSIMRLQYYYPDATIIALLPTYTSSYYPESRLLQYNALMTSICDYFDVLYVDLSKCGILPLNLATTLGDGIHPTIKGFELIEEYIKDIYVNGNKKIEDEDDIDIITYYNSLPSTYPNASVNVEGHGWADGTSTSLYNKEINTISFYSSNTSGVFEFGIAESLNCSSDRITNIQTINWDTSNLIGNMVTLNLLNSITLKNSEYIVIYPQTKPESGAFLYYSSSSGNCFYSDCAISRRGRTSWNLCSNLSLGIKYGYSE